MRYIYIILFIVSSLCLHGQNTPHQAPLNPAFVNQKIKKGYINAPYKVVHSKLKSRSGRSLPSSFDLRDDNGETYIPAIRDQNPHGTCWTFATFASVESAWKRNGAIDFTDLSESNMAKCHGYELDIDSGGNEFMSTAYLSRLSGPLYEHADPYSEITTTRCFDINKERDIPAYVDQIAWIGNDRELIKEMIMKHGAASTSMMGQFSTTYYNSEDYTYFFNGTEPPSHGVAIVGWDDEMIITGGTSEAPKEPGAWIVRNSWGLNAQDKGYFYASYEDRYIGKNCEFYYGATPISDVDTLFDYAKLGAITAHRVGDAATEVAYAAVKYETDKPIFITHIGASILNEGTIIDLTICRSFDGINFTDTVIQKADFFCKFAGFQKLEMPALLDSGVFYILAKYYTPQSDFPLPVEAKVEKYASPHIEEGKMWLSANGVSWQPGGANTNYDFDLAIKVYAQYPDIIQPYFTVNKSHSCVGQPVEFINTSYGVADSFVWIVNDEQLVTKSVDSALNYTFNSTGDMRVEIKAYLNGIAYSFVREKAITVVSQIYPQIMVAHPSDYYAKGKPITLFADGADTYEWYADGYLAGRTGRIITFTPDVDELWVRLEAQMGECFESDSILLKFVDVPYDDIEDALLLQIGIPANEVTNAYASVETNEPFPQIGSCESQSTWCAEGGLQNSIWFKFRAPASGNIMISTMGFDTQIALYEATHTGSWEDIMSGNPDYYVILAANDDYHEDYSALIENVGGLTPNKMYWVQMDGSAGGVVGKASIVVNNVNTSSMQELDEDTYTVLNTSQGLKLYGNSLNGATLTIVNSMGQKVYGQIINSDFTSINGDILKEGVYFVSINNTQSHFVYKVVVTDHWQMTLHER